MIENVTIRVQSSKSESKQNDLALIGYRETDSPWVGVTGASPGMELRGNKLIKHSSQAGYVDESKF